MVRGSNPDVGEIFCTRPDRSWVPPSHLYSGYRVFPGDKAAVRGFKHSPPSGDVVNGRVVTSLLLSGPSWPFLGWIFISFNNKYASLALGKYRLVIHDIFFFFDVLLTVHLSSFISVINQLDAQNFCFTISFVSCLYMFRAPCAHHQEVKIALHSLWYHHTYRCDDTRGWPPDDEHMCSEHVEAWNKTYCKTNILCIKVVNYWDK